MSPEWDLARADGQVAPTPERRAAPRWMPASACRVLLRLAKAPDALSCHGAVLNLSRGGAMLHLDEGAAEPALAVGAELRLEIRLGPDTHERRARIAWLTSGAAGASGAADGVILGVEHLTLPDGVSPRGLELDVSGIRIDPAWALRIPASLALRRRVLPLCSLGEHVVVAFADAGDSVALAAVRRHIDRPIIAQQADPGPLMQAIRKVHGELRAAAEVVADDAVASCEELLHAAWLRQASDIHVCPQKDDVLVRLRVDGQLEDYRRFPIALHAELVSRIKILAGMDIAERRAPQDGRFTHSLVDGGRVEIRAATLPTNHGERATLRLLAIEEQSLTLEHLGMSAAHLTLFARNLARTHGLILATGPTGCGKTTTLYAALRRIISVRSVNAIAVQEPVEYDIPGITQVEVDPGQKITFGSALRNILRHDPDVIMVGEIRDRETADIAIKAALTGHLVLATLHTNSAASAVTRLVDMGVEGYLLAATLRAVVAQRLVRRLCPHCRKPVELSAAEGATFGLFDADRSRLRAPRGCVYCAGRGYAGRAGLFELISIDDALSNVILRGGDELALARAARARGMRAMRDDAVDKLLDGTTSFAEVLTALEFETERGDLT